MQTRDIVDAFADSAVTFDSTNGLIRKTIPPETGNTKYQNISGPMPSSSAERSTQSPREVFNLIRRSLPTYPLLPPPPPTSACARLYPPHLCAVNRTVKLFGLIFREAARATDDKSDCSDGISIRGRLYRIQHGIPCGALGCTLSSYRAVREQQAARGVGRGRGRTNTSASN